MPETSLDHSVLSISPFKFEKSEKLSRTTRSLLIFTAVKDEGKFDRTDLKLNISKLNRGGTNDLSTTVRIRKIFFSSVVANCSANCYWLAPVVLLSGFKAGFVAHWLHVVSFETASRDIQTLNLSPNMSKFYA